MATKKSTTTRNQQETVNKSTAIKTAATTNKAVAKAAVNSTAPAMTPVAKATANSTAPATTHKTTRAKVDAPMIVRQVRRPTSEEIAQRAYSLFERRGYAHGCDVQDWVQAEMELQYKF
jgi:hypothetical protein